MTLLVKNAVNILNNTPIVNVSAKPCITVVLNLSPNQYNTTATIIVEKFPSRIEGHALSKPEVIAESILFPDLISSLVLSAIRTFASTANPSDRMIAAAPDKVKVTDKILKVARSKIV